jgi:hypothetical protein
LFATTIQLAGLTAVATGICLMSIPAGIIFIGFALILVGLAIEKGK